MPVASPELLSKIRWDTSSEVEEVVLRIKKVGTSPIKYEIIICSVNVSICVMSITHILWRVCSDVVLVKWL